MHITQLTNWHATFWYLIIPPHFDKVLITSQFTILIGATFQYFNYWIPAYPPILPLLYGGGLFGDGGSFYCFSRDGSNRGERERDSYLVL